MSDAAWQAVAWAVASVSAGWIVTTFFKMLGGHYERRVK